MPMSTFFSHVVIILPVIVDRTDDVPGRAEVSVRAGGPPMVDTGGIAPSRSTGGLRPTVLVGGIAPYRSVPRPPAQ
jgi:hypothetical protein